MYARVAMGVVSVRASPVVAEQRCRRVAAAAAAAAAATC